MKARIAAWSIAAVGISLNLLFNVLDFVNGHAVSPPLAGTFVGMAFLIVGALIAARRPSNPIGWIYLVAALLISFGGTGNVSEQYAYYALVGHPGSLPAPEWMLWAGQVMLSIAFPGLLFFSLLVFPDGHLPSPRWRPLAFLLGGTTAAFACAAAISKDFMYVASATVPSPISIEAARDAADVVGIPIIVLFLAILLGCVASIVARWRGAQGLERQQLKWFAFGAGVIPAVVLVGGVLSVLAPEVMDESGGNFYPLSVAGLPVATAIAILRYRLYDIDVLINRALVYGPTSAGIAVAFFAGIVVLQALLRPITGGSELAVAASTLASVALFQPFRRRIQSAVDRRFYRARYDADRTLDAFSERLREEVDLGALEAGLLRVVDDAMRPAQVSLWLRDRTAADQPASS